MDTPELRYLLERSRHTIVSLRDRNRTLEAQVGVIEVFAAALGLRANNHGAEVDVAWELQSAIDRLSEENAMATPSPQEPT